MKSHRLSFVFIGLWVALQAAAVSAQTTGAIELQTVAQKELRIAAPGGDVEVKLVPAGKVVPGDRIVYTIVARNVSAQPADRIVITDPIPEHMTYVDGSADSGVGGVLFSVDGGMRFAAPEQLRVIGEDGAPRRAEPRDYTHVRFVFDEPLLPSGEQAVRFVAQLD
jgi:uncharacterized repeat protein (TIGR01451 family)